jgi:hypothetical protein
VAAFSPGSFLPDSFAPDGFLLDAVEPAYSRIAFAVAAFSEVAFSFDAATPPEPDVVTSQLIGGGYNPSQGLYPRPPSRQQVSRDRERVGLLDELALQAIAEVAARQAERLEQDAQKRFDELSRELQLRGLEWEARYLETLNAKREELIDAEILSRLKAKFRADDEMIVLMLLAASI